MLGFIDDALLVVESPEECEKAVFDYVELFQQLGFAIHDVKSVFVPSQLITFLILC